MNDSLASAEPHAPSRPAPQPVLNTLRGVSRRLARRLPFRPHDITLDAPIVSFTFDDFPQSCVDNAAPALEEAGMRGTFYLASNRVGTVLDGQRIADWDAVRALAARGHEIGTHTHDHIDVQRAGAKLLADVARNEADIAREVGGLPGQPAVTSFAYPYGIVSLASKKRLMDRYSTLRGIQPGLNVGRVDLAHLHAEELYDASSDEASIEALLDEAEERRGWLVFYTHDVQDAPSDIGCSPARFAHAVARVRARGLAVMTMAEAAVAIGAGDARSRAAA